MLEIHRSENGTLILNGRLDSSGLAILGDHLRSIKGSVEIDLSGVFYINSAGLGMLLGTHQRLKDDDGGLEIIKCSAFIREVFDISGLDHLISINC